LVLRTYVIVITHYAFAFANAPSRIARLVFTCTRCLWKQTFNTSYASNYRANMFL